MPSGKLYNGDCLAVMRTMESDSVSSIVTDPPYGLKFMGKQWDYDVPSVEIWKEALRVLKPGGTALIFAGSRTQHRMAVNVEDAGFVLKDCIMWIYGSGFPKSTDISKQIDKVSKRLNMFQPFADHLKKKISESELTKKQISEHFPSKTGGLTGCVWNWENAENVPTKEQFQILNDLLDLSDEFTELIDRVEAEREVIGTKTTNKTVYQAIGSENTSGEIDITKPATPEAQLWNGYGTALKPAYEPIIVAMKPNDGTYANNALKHGVAGLNIDGCRVPATDFEPKDRVGASKLMEDRPWQSEQKEKGRPRIVEGNDKGRFPANIIHDGSEEVLSLFPETKSGARSGEYGANGDVYGKYANKTASLKSSSGSAARFFYCAKASKKDRGEGNTHPTVKPLALMRYLVKLVMPPEDGVIMDNFMGSGTTGVVCKELGISFIGIEKDTEDGSYTIAKTRICEAVNGK